MAGKPTDMSQILELVKTNVACNYRENLQNRTQTIGLLTPAFANESKRQGRAICKQHRLGYTVTLWDNPIRRVGYAEFW